MTTATSELKLWPRLIYLTSPMSSWVGMIQAVASILASKRDYHGREENFIDAYDDSRPIVYQMEAFVAKHGLKLESGWKVELARPVKRRVQMNPALLEQTPSLLIIWKKLFGAISGTPVNKTLERKGRETVALHEGPSPVA